MSKLKILVFEYITGGGLNNSELPESLAKEGLLMLQSLVNDLSKLSHIELHIMLDVRMLGKLTHSTNTIHTIRPDQNCHQEFTRITKTCDAVWPIAPESTDILHSFCQTVEHSGKHLLNTNAGAVVMTGNKWLTYHHLLSHSINTVETAILANFAWTSGEWVFKPVDGVGCEENYCVTNHDEYIAITSSLNKDNTIVQPNIQGDKISLSCLFKQGRGWLICANRQHFELKDKQYRLTGITVNFTANISQYLSLVDAIATSLPDLWGYAGIDLIQTDQQIYVLEINPRLTTSYAGISRALGINCANAVLELLNGDPMLEPTGNQPVFISITDKENHAD
jgi:tyramine---L-glutamate ligase